MSPSFKQWLYTIGQIRYVNRSLIFALDLCFSVMGTFFSYVYILSFFNKFELSNSNFTLLALSATISTILFFSTGLYKIIIRYSTLKELPKIIYILLAKEILLGFGAYHFNIIPKELLPFCGLADLLFSTFLMVGCRAFIVSFYYSLTNINSYKRVDAFVYSTLERSPMIAELINKNPKLNMRVRGFLTTSKRKKGFQIYGEKVYWLDGNQDNLLRLFKKSHVSAVIFTSQQNFNRERNGLAEFCINNKIKMYISSELQNFDSTPDLKKNLKPIQIEDLLERNVIEVEMEKIKGELKDKVVMVTGAAGSIGSEIANQLALFGVKELICFDSAETPLHNLQLSFESRYPDIKVYYCLGDVRSRDRVTGIINRYRPSIIYHAAAYKHVPMIESNPCEAVKVNIWGTLNLARRAVECGVERFVMVSTDKAVNPTNVMGASKRIAELCVQHYEKKAVTKFITTRFGNVLGSNGSVIPRFKEQIAKGGPITVTHPNIIRYFMTIPEACRLVLQASAMGEGGEIFVFDMGEQVKIIDLARKMISLSGLIPDEDIKIVYTGLRPGEKLYEELLSDTEKTSATNHKKIRISHTTVELPDNFDDTIEKLIAFSASIDIENSIVSMKKIVPEFVSKNSEFEKYDQTVKKQETI